MAAAGLDWAWRIFSMTPREISLAIRAHEARQHQRQQDLWLLSRYGALAVHAPDRLPPPPMERMLPMTDEAMKQRLLAWQRKDD